MKVIYLPEGPEGAKTGLDDFFARGGTKEELLALAEAAGARGDGAALVSVARPEGIYLAEEDGFFILKPGKGGTVERLRLTSFVAQIEEEVIKDPEDGGERFYVVRAKVDEHETTFEVPAEDFARFEWVSKYLGARAIVAAGMGMNDHARVAIQTHSRPRIKTVYSSLGWVQIDGVPHFRHVGGAIGPEGNRDDVEVEPPPELRVFRLPAPPEERGLQRAFAAVLRLKAAYDSATFWRLFALVVAALLGDFVKLDFVAWVFGGTGKLKSTSAALFSNFSGDVERGTLPGNFKSTANALESRGYRAKNCLFVVDDYLPAQDRFERQEKERLVISIIRQVGDNQGRARLTRDLRDRPQRPYRGCVLVTAEVPPPGGTSTQARCFLIPWDQARIDRGLLAKAEAEDRDSYREFTAAFLQYIARNWKGLGQVLPERVKALRAAKAASHARLAEIRAKLFAALEVYALFTLESGLQSEESAREQLLEAEKAFDESTEATSVRERDERPANRLIEAVKTLLSEKLGYFESDRGSEPQHPERWGWTEKFEMNEETQKFDSQMIRPPGASRLGRVDQRASAQVVYLVPDVTRRVISDKLRMDLPGADELGASLLSEGLLAAREKDRYQKSVRLGGPPQRVLAIHLRAFADPDDPNNPENTGVVSEEPI